MSKKKLIFALIAVAIVLRVLFASQYTISGDACRHMTTAVHFSEHFTLPAYEGVLQKPLWAPPAFHIMAGLVYAAFSWISFSFAEFFVRLLSPLINGIGIFFLYKLYKELGVKDKVTVFAITFYAFTPLLLYYGYLPYMDTIFTSFIIISLYYFIKEKYIVSGLLFALSILTKYNALPMGLLFVYIWYKKVWPKKTWFIDGVKFALPVIIFGSLWFIRNFRVFGNPISNGATGSAQDIMSFVNPQIYFSQYVELFGVPAANPANLQIIANFSELLLAAWFIITALYIVPLIIGIAQFKKIPSRDIVAVGLAASFIFFAFLMYNRSGEAFMRLLMTFFIFVPLLWGYGCAYIQQHIKKKNVLRFLFYGFLIGACLMFVVQEPLKLHLANKRWVPYQDTFTWVQENTPEAGIFLANGAPDAHYPDNMGEDPCLPYYTHRTFSLYHGEAQSGTYIYLDGGESPLDANLLYEDTDSRVKIFKQS